MNTGWLRTTPGYLLSLAAGAMTALAFAPVNMPVLAVVMPALLAAIWITVPPRSAFVHGYVYGLGLFGIGVSWLHISINQFGGVGFPFAVVLTFLFIAFIALYPALTGYLSRRFFTNTGRGAWLILVLPSLWVLLEWMRGRLLTGFPWLNLGYSQIDTPLAGLAPLAGVYALSWASVLTACLIAGLFLGSGRQRALMLILLALIWSGSWLIADRQWTQGQGEPVKVALVQGAVPQSLKWDPRVRKSSMELYLDLTRPHLGADLIIWPETSIPAFYHQVSGFMDDLTALAREHDSRILVGIPVRDEQSGNYYNSLVSLQANTERYDKRHLVPFGEYLPFRSILDEVLRFLDIPISDFSPGNAGRPLLDVNGMALGVSICYEDAFGEEVIEALPEAGILVNVSNDAWFGDSFAPHQHLQMARMRALESGRYLLRATNTGVSAIIDERGRVETTTAQFQPAVLTGQVQARTGLTPYASGGNAPAVIAALLLLAVAIVRDYRSGARRSA